MAKAKKITATNVVQALGITPKGIKIITLGDGDLAVNVAIKTFLTIKERTEFVQIVSDMVFKENHDGVEEYTPALKKFATEYAIVGYFTNISLPSKAESIRDFLETTNLAKFVTDQVGVDYIEELIAEVNDSINHRREIISKRSKIDTLIDGVVGIVNAFGEKMKDMDVMQIAETFGVNMPELKGDFEQLLKSNAGNDTPEQ